MDIKKVLLVKSLRELQTITACLSQSTNKRNRYLQRDQNEYKFILHTPRLKK